ncbi:U11/U12 small nuclear ribonucleoprotein 48 kDa protein-like [Mizuhopecten yessoensis]|uniref:U11/U12 small nuclear ribonucleoprotein 48 kDa protein n=1 Tax=Mizuhopecten yessoensis TaxID=6573 RepID=A0A210PUV1_MIZYE|nr:U11/U12 small nuclear ribonucleoprotein 48 kDa protein-like [Mizuhopecten yessoensis]XP_021374777.1 U11/U12 small nuclear ribonucleoprotein 48 kDa protein-like [Mizuhopecten yessoensis]OWF40235.1 U11/U12 small nuclear ribonucleoprotein 48 kDa protein [Mizuhopecten yessoensis]
MDAATKKDSFISELKEFVDVCQDNLNNVLHRIGWTPDNILEHEDRGLCPHDSNHVMPATSLEKHAAICPLLKKGYNKEEATQQQQSNRYFYEGLEARVPTVNIDQETVNKILWDHHVKNRSIFYGQKDDCLTRDDQEVQLTAAEKAAIYEFVVSKAKEEREFTPLEDEFLTMNLEEFVKKKISGKDGANDSKPANYLEYIKSERDYKRRRQTYRAKNVYTTKKSYTEVIRDVIENQTDLFASFMSLEDKGSTGQEHGEDVSGAGSLDRTKDSADLASEEIFMDRRKSYSSSRGRSRERSSDKTKEWHSRSRDQESRRSRNLYHVSQRSVERSGLEYSRERGGDQPLERDSLGEIAREERQERGKRRSRSLSESSDSEYSKKHKKHHKKHKHKHKHKKHKSVKIDHS